jgi:peptidoglycan hydrolase CwlO-like protein
LSIVRYQCALVRAAVALAVGCAVLVPTAVNARPTHPVHPARPVQEDDPADDDGSSQVELEIDPLRADDSDVESAFSDIQENVLAQRSQLETAQQRVTDAQGAVDTARSVVAQTQAELDLWVAESDEVVIQAFITSPSERAFDALTSATAGDAAVKQALLDMTADEDADVLAGLDATQRRLEDEQAAEEEAVEAAQQAVEAAQTALEDLEAAVSQQTQFTNEVEARLEQQLGEIEALRDSDPELAEQLEARAGSLAGDIAESRRLLQEETALEEAGVAPADPGAPDGPSTITVEGGLAVVSCPQGLGSIQVAGVIARDLQGLLNLAAEQGLPLCGNGWRDPAEQVALRRSHCGSSHYAIYEAPASACSPPTARPGQSLHEQGLAIDFTCAGSTVSWGDRCHDFLRAHAADFGFHPLSSEPWHFSPTGQ